MANATFFLEFSEYKTKSATITFFEICCLINKYLFFLVPPPPPPHKQAYVLVRFYLVHARMATFYTTTVYIYSI
jgi:hypothetical protein